MFENINHLNGKFIENREYPNNPIDYPECARELIEDGYGIIKLPIEMQEQFWRAIDLYADLASEEKREFSFPSDTDGFFPFGMEYAKSTNQIDLCERFCYWHKNRSQHGSYIFSGSDFYDAISKFETGMSVLATEVLNSICQVFGVSSTIEIRDSSYMQLCAYEKRYRRPEREYSQDRHEDGHLITFIKGNRDGLVIFPHGERCAIHLDDDEIIVITGSLLTLLSDGRIPYMDHAVLNQRVPVARSSLVYFVLPNLKKQYVSFVERKPLNLESVANESHAAFGNYPFADGVDQKLTA